VAVDIGDRRGPEDADLRVALDPDHEIGALSALIAIASTLPTAPTLDEIAGATAVGLDAHRTRGGASWDAARQLLPLLTHGCYVAIVADGESDLPREAGAARAEALARAAQALNGPSRCALVTLRGGGNRVGADAVLTAQTGYPMTIDFARGYPRYVPFEDARARLRAGQIDAVLVAGDVARAADDTIRLISERPHAIIGPRATAGPLRDGAAAIDTAVAGIHEGGTALRLDDVPLPLRASVDGPPAAADVLRRLVQRMAAAPWQP
jgi:formylmethanofuran dehydrogenase subunit B